MKAEERKHLRQNELKTGLASTWERLSSNTSQSHRVWAVILLGLVGLMSWVTYSRITARGQSELWFALDFAGDAALLEKIASEHPDTKQGQIARFHLARVRAAEGLSQIGVMSGDERVAAAKKLEEVRTIYGELVKSSSLPVEMTQEALAQLGKVEEVLASVPKDDSSAMRGSLDAALKFYDDLVARYPKCFFAQEASKRATDIRANRAEIEKLYASMAEIHAKSPPPVAPINVTPADPLPTTPK